jgi:hypothetical protein
MIRRSRKLYAKSECGNAPELMRGIFLQSACMMRGGESKCAHKYLTLAE